MLLTCFLGDIGRPLKLPPPGGDDDNDIVDVTEVKKRWERVSGCESFTTEVQRTTRGFYVGLHTGLHHVIEPRTGVPVRVGLICDLPGPAKSLERPNKK